jgi:DivIVA domain-containing protein
MTEERRLTIASSSRLHPEDVARHTFATSRRGFDPGEVRAYLEQVARELHAAAARERELLDELSDAERRAANPVLDEATLTSALGQETARVLRSAHDAAAELVAKAESDAGRLRAQAQEETEQLRARAEESSAELAQKADAAASEVHRRAQEEASARVETAKVEAEAMLSQARAECRAMVQEAQELRARVLSDLTRRRRVLHTQIEQLRAGRERLAETISEVRHTVDQVSDDLLRAEDEARSAAEAAGRQAGHDELDEVALDHGVAAVEETVTSVAGAPATSRPEGGPDEEQRQQAVEDLFARLRAEQAPVPADEGVTVLGPVPPSSSGGESTLPSGTSAQVEGGEAVDGTEGAEAPLVTGLPAGAEGAEEPDKEPDPVLARRDELLGPVTTGLARRLKRALADDQNAILDRLRGAGAWSDDVLGAAEEQERRYVEASQAQLHEARRAGAAFAGGSLERAPAVDEQAVALARAVVAPLRRRLVEKSAGIEAGDDAAITEHVGSAFREWKGQRMERVAADHAHGAFWEAAMSAAGKGTKLRWIVDDDGVQCPDCDDNALAGALTRGEAFPTGHVHPPAHPGCRCLLVPDNA